MLNRFLNFANNGQQGAQGQSMSPLEQVQAVINQQGQPQQQQPPAAQQPMQPQPDAQQPQPQPQSAPPADSGGIFGAQGLLNPTNRYALGMGLLAKAHNRHANVFDTALPAVQEFKKQQEIEQKQQAMKQFAQDIQSSPLLKDPQTRKLVSEAMATGNPELMKYALAAIKQPTPDKPYTLGKDQLRYDANNNLVAKGLTSDEKSYKDILAGQRVDINKLQSMPVNQRAYLYAQAAGMGYGDPAEVTNLLLEGKTLKDLAKEKGFDMQHMPSPIYPTTTGSQTQIQKRQQALTELSKLGNTITEWTAPYARRFKGYSIPAMLDAVKGQNTDQLSKFLAAKGLSLDQAGIRVRSLGGQVGESVLHDMVSSAMGKINFPESLLNTEVYTKTQKYMDQAIRESVQAANKVGLQPGLANEEAASDAQSLEQQAQDAIAKGADPAAVSKMLAELKANQNG